MLLVLCASRADASAASGNPVAKRDVAGGILSFASESIPVNEDAKQLSVDVRLFRTSAGEVKVDYYTTNRTARAGQDYQPSAGSLVFANSETNKTIVIQILDDLLAEGDEVFGVVLTNCVGATFRGKNEMLVAIRDGERPVVRDATFEIPTPPDGDIPTLALQPDGKVLIGGSFFTVDSFPIRSVARLNPDGTVDRTFNPHRNAGINGPISALQVLPDGSVLVAGSFTLVQGYSRPGLARLLTNGVADLEFLPVGVPVPILAMAAQSDGKIIIAGGKAPIGPQLGRYLPNGKPDPTFGLPGAFGIPGRSSGETVLTFGAQSDGSIVAGGFFSQLGGRQRPGLARIKPNGLLDESFDVSLTPRNGSTVVRGLIVQPDNKIVIAGYFEKVNGVDRPGLARLNADGSLDTSFGPADNGPVNFSQVQSLVLGPNEAILWVGNGSPLAGDSRSGIVGLDVTGSLYPSFNPASDSKPQTPFVSSAVIQPDGRVLVAGKRVDRLFADSADLRGLGFAAANTNRVAEGSTLQVIVERLGDLDATLLTATLETRSGTAIAGQDFVAISTNVMIAPGARTAIVSIPILPDGKAELEEKFEVVLRNPALGLHIGGRSRLEVTIADADPPSVVDLSFHTDSGWSGPVAVQADGKILTPAGATLLRLNSDGTVDSSFQQTLLTNRIASIEPYADGRVLVATMEATWNCCGFFLSRLRADGTIDRAFTPPPFRGSKLLGLYTRPDGKAIIASGGGILLLNEDGSRDNSLAFERNVIPTAFALQADGKFLLHEHLAAIFNYVSIQRHLPNGSLDSTFRAPWFALDGTPEQVTSIATAPDGSVYFSGFFQHLQGIRLPGLAKVHSNGVLDLDFHPDPSVFLSSFLPSTIWPPSREAFPVAISPQPDGKVLLLLYRFGIVGYPIEGPIPGDSLVRLNPDGSLDPEFQFDRIFQGRAGINAMAVQPDGNIVVIAASREIWGDYNPRLLRIFSSSHSAPRLGFATNEFFVGESDARPAVTLRREGDIGSSASVELRLSAGTAAEGEDFAPFTTTLQFAPFETEKTVLLPIRDDPFAEADETITATLASPRNSALNLAKANVTIVDDDRPGSLDPSFIPRLGELGSDERVSVGKLGVMEDGTVVAETTRYRPQAESVIVFLRPDGSLIAKFPKPDSGFTLWALAAVTGSTTFVWALRGSEPQLVQLQSDGTIAKSFPVELPSRFVPPNTLLPLPDGSFLATGVVGTVRISANGTSDKSFKLTSAPYGAWDAAIDSSGKFLLVGGFTQVNGVTNSGVARVNSDGSLDSSFTPRAGVAANLGSFGVYTVAIQPDGKILLGGRFDSCNGVLRRNLARINPDGTLDSAYDAAPALAEIEPSAWTVNRIALQSDGKALILFETTGGFQAARLNADGSVDRTFAFTGRLGTGRVLTVTLQANGDGLIGGSFTTVNDTPRLGLARLRADSILRIDSIQLDPVGGKWIAVAVSPGKPYVLESSSDLSTWSPIMTNLATSARLDLDDRISPNRALRFYRVKRLP